MFNHKNKPVRFKFGCEDTPKKHLFHLFSNLVSYVINQAVYLPTTDVAKEGSLPNEFKSTPVMVE